MVVATGNAGKLKEMQRYLEGMGWELQIKPAELEVEETGRTFAENARLKASQIAQATGQWTIADDSGLMVDALNGAPGVYSARYGETDQARISRLLRELEQLEGAELATPSAEGLEKSCAGSQTKSQITSQANRRAEFQCVVAIARPDGSIALEAEGRCGGNILRQPIGSGGFGYDPIFYVPALGLTFAEMSPEQKRQVSHRGRAFATLLPQLQNLKR